MDLGLWLRQPAANRLNRLTFSVERYPGCQRQPAFRLLWRCLQKKRRAENVGAADERQFGEGDRGKIMVQFGALAFSPAFTSERTPLASSAAWNS